MKSTYGSILGALNKVLLRFDRAFWDWNLKSKENLLDKDLKLHLFNNDQAAFDDFEPLSTYDLQLEETGEDAYRIDFRKSLSLPSGLYYYVLEELDQEKILFVEKFKVN